MDRNEMTGTVSTPGAPASDIPDRPRQPIHIKPRHGWRFIDWREVLAYRDLLYFLVWRDIKVLYKQTILGFSWAVIRPLLSMVIFSIVFGRLAKISSDGVPYPIFAYAALVPWMYFSAALTKSAQSLVADANTLSKVYFPRIIIPLVPVLAGLVDFSISFAIMGLLMIFYGVYPGVTVVFLGLPLLLMILTAAGIGLWLSAMAIQYRDIKHGVHFLAQVLMYAAPVVWPASLIPDRFRVLYGLYPMAGVIEGFRSTLIGTRPMPWDLLACGAITASALAVSGAFYFRRMERIFADVA